MADLSARIEEAASGPAQASADGASVTQQDLSDLIEADKYLKQVTAAANRKPAIRIFKVVPPGTV